MRSGGVAGRGGSGGSVGSGVGQRSGVPGGTAAPPQEAVTPQRPREEREGRGAWVVAVAVPPPGELPLTSHHGRLPVLI